MKERSSIRPVFIAAEIAVLVFVFLLVLLTGSSDRMKNIADKNEYPRYYYETVRKYCAEYGAEENLIFAIIKAESAFDPKAESKCGALGLMQIMPSTYEGDIKERLGLSETAEKALTDPETNIKCGVYYFSYWHGYFGSENCAIASYNAGPGKVSGWTEQSEYYKDGDLIIHNIPILETMRYVAKVKYYRDMYDKIYGKGDSFVSRAECLKYAKLYGNKYKVDFNLIMAVIETESSFRKNVVSSSGAVGLMQLKDSTYKVDIAPNINVIYEPERLFEAEYNIMCGAYYLHWLDTRKNIDGIEMIAASYHGGIGTVWAWLDSASVSEDGKLIINNIPDEATKKYVEKIKGFYVLSVNKYGNDEAYKFEW